MFGRLEEGKEALLFFVKKEAKKLPAGGWGTGRQMGTPFLRRRH
jgi:hypothetical protein